ncbi:MAG TPA: hypothetical protein VGR62_25265 [Candidatus Binatia bacterium]|jgi:hypothetical protein|nr:hypothetical protein [Candidatus Binatia bacterium]
MGSLVEFRCPTCSYATPKLQVGWGKAGRANYWGGLALCEACKDVVCVDLSDTRTDRRDRRCATCNGPLKLIEGIAERVPCPKCTAGLKQSNLGSWS